MVFNWEAAHSKHYDNLSYSYDDDGSTLSVAIVASFCNSWLTRELRRTIHGVAYNNIVSTFDGRKTGSSSR